VFQVTPQGQALALHYRATLSLQDAVSQITAAGG
jgi:hypothetical protein